MMSFYSGLRSTSQPSSCDEYKGHAKKNYVGSKVDAEALTIYLLFLSACGLVVQMFDGVGLSTLPTLSVSLQILALGFLWSKIQQTRNASGISAKTLILQGMVNGLRLCSTTWLKGYIPADETGDWLYQAMDAVTLLLCLKLTYIVTRKHRLTYEADLDSFDIKPVVVVCFFVAILVHPDLNDRILFDAIWATSLYIDVVAMMPQLWLMSKGGSVESLTGHYIAAVALSRGCSLCFWYYGYVELAPLDGGLNIAGGAIIVAHLLQAILFCDFMYFYIRNWARACNTLCTTSERCNTLPKDPLVSSIDAEEAEQPVPDTVEDSTVSQDSVDV